MICFSVVLLLITNWPLVNALSSPEDKKPSVQAPPAGSLLYTVAGRFHARARPPVVSLSNNRLAFHPPRTSEAQSGEGLHRQGDPAKTESDRT